jgi:ribosomal protein L16 Arg81 hydroxylase
MGFVEIFERMEGGRDLAPVRSQGERYYVFGGVPPAEVVAQTRWPAGFEYVGSSHYIASAGVTAKTHYDLWWAFLLQLHGKKRIKLFPPSDYSFMYPVQDARTDHDRRSLVDLVNPDLDRYQLLRRLHGLEVTLAAGDLFFLPSRWWHEVDTQEFSIGINRRFRRSSLHYFRDLAGYSFNALKSRYVYRTTSKFPVRIQRQLLAHSFEAIKTDCRCVFRSLIPAPR